MTETNIYFLTHYGKMMIYSRTIVWLIFYFVAKIE